MIGSLFAGTDESPGRRFLYQNRSYKAYRGMGSIGSHEGRQPDRYAQESTLYEGKLVPEGIEAWSRTREHRGDDSSVDRGPRAGMGYFCGCRSIRELKSKSRFIRITTLGLRESHVHDVKVTKEAPNYRTEL